MKRIFTLTMLLFACFSGAQAQNVVSISQARATAAGQTITVKGIVTNGSELGVIRYLQDDVAGIAAYGAILNPVQAGDSILVTGVLKQYNNLLEIDPVSTVEVLNSNNPLPAPRVLTLAEGLAEQYESMLVKFEEVTTNSTGNFAGNTNYTITKGGVSKAMRINSSTNIVGTPIPTTVFNVTGIMSQFNTTYQLLPRYVQDIATGSGPVFAQDLVQSNITTSSFDLSFETVETAQTIIYYGTTRTLTETPIVNPTLVTSHEATLTNLSPATIYYARAAAVDASGDTTFGNIKVFATASNSSGDIKVYFNSSVDTTYAYTASAVQLNTTIDDTLINYINRATQSIDAALYNLNNNGLSNISAALNDAYNRGLSIRVVADSSTAMIGLASLSPNIKVLRSPIGERYGIMHNKFFIFDCESMNPDKPIVWTGSTNLTSDQVNVDPNSVIIIQDQSLARAYKIEFEEMWGSNTSTPNKALAKFGPDKADNTPHLFNIGGKKVESYFSPSDAVESKIIATINSADHDVEVATMLITRNAFAQAIRNRVNDANIFAAVLVDDTSGTGSQTPYATLATVLPAGEKLFVNNTDHILHHKYVIVDQSNAASDPAVSVGSHNWSAAAETKNDENTLIIHDVTIANIYFQEWAQRFKELGGTYVLTSAGEGKPMEKTIVYALYPNPASESVNISYHAVAGKTVNIKLVDMRR